MKLTILKRPRSGTEIKLFERLKNSLKHVPLSSLIGTVDKYIEEFNLEFGMDIRFHLNEYNLIVLNEDGEEIIVFRINNQ